ncbi:hypothetical protein GX408_14330 [bacterium]|nr:hypothetical protein [bacterium]
MARMFTVLLFILCSLVLAQDEWITSIPSKNAPASEWEAWRARRDGLAKSFGRHDERREGTHNGNRISTVFYNYGSIGQPSNSRSLVWPAGTSNRDYAFEFGMLVAGEIVDKNRQRRHIISDGLDTGGDRSTQGAVWGWEPKSGYARPGQSYIAMSHQPNTWPVSWAHVDDNHDGKFDGSWWGEYGVNVITADQESFFVMDDSTNAEFLYWPDPIGNPDRRGLGMDVRVRGYQWAHTLAQDCIFFIYDVRYVGADTIKKVYVGMYGDPHIGGADDYSDDDGFYDTKLDMVYGWDHDFRGSPDGWRPGYLGYKFLESPGEPYDGKDNDEDGMVDESMQNNIDDDHDWDPRFDDVGADGVDGDLNGNGIQDGNEYWDRGERDGVPTHGEPNFDEKDLDEADQIGLTSFSVFEYGTIWPSQDEDTWRLMVSGIIDSTFDQTKDNVFMYASGPVQMARGDSRRFSIALFFGYDIQDLYRNARTIQEIYDAGYRFAKAPNKPRLTAVPGDGKVTLYWDSAAEDSRDPIYGKDFEGYAIYRGTDVGFLESFTITDALGNPKMWKPIARFDLKNGIRGPHKIETTTGIHYYQGDDTGLSHSYVDSGLVNGQRYFYAVVSYDRGDSLKIAPSECTKSFFEDPPNSGNYVPDVNTAIVVPQAPVAGYEPPRLFGALKPTQNEDGPGTGIVTVDLIDPNKIRDGHRYVISFDDSTQNKTVFNMYDRDLVERDTLQLRRRWKYTRWENVNGAPRPVDSVRVVDVNLAYGHLIAGSLTVTNRQNTAFIEDRDYAVSYSEGRITVLDTMVMRPNADYVFCYNRRLISSSPYLDGSDRNPYEHGLKVVVKNDSLLADRRRSRFIAGRCNYQSIVEKYPNSGVAYPADYRIEISDKFQEKSVNAKAAKFRVYNITEKTYVPFVFFDVNNDSTIGDQDKVVPTTLINGRTTGTWQVRFFLHADSIVYRNGVPVDTVAVPPIAPKAGDVYLIAVRKPFSWRDVFTFQTMASTVRAEKARSALSSIAVVPNPYISASEFERQPRTQAGGRGDRLLYFIHLPATCTIRIYTVSGDHVVTLEHQAGLEDGSQAWDLLNKDRMDIAYGVYLYHVDAPGIGEYVGKFAVIK